MVPLYFIRASDTHKRRQFHAGFKMGLIDRYTIQRWKTFCLDFAENTFYYLSRLFALCNENNKTRLISLISIICLLFVSGWLLSLSGPKPLIPESQKLVLKEADAQGNNWTIDYLKNQNVQAILETDKKTGQPLTLKMKFHRKSEILYMLPEVTGNAGEKYFPGILKNGKWLDPPKVVIADINNKQIHTGQFEYG